MREDGYIARRAKDAILGCPAGAAFQHAAMLVTQLVADHRPAPVRALPLFVRQLPLLFQCNTRSAKSGSQLQERPRPSRRGKRGLQTTTRQAAGIDLARASLPASGAPRLGQRRHGWGSGATAGAAARMLR
jgi:hypothetical protein